MSIRILLVDDHKIVRDGLRALIEKEDAMEVVGEAQDGRQALKFVGEHAPDVVILDIGMPGLNGIETAGKIAAGHPCTKIIGLSMHSDRRFVSEMLKAGASGYMLKDCAFEELILAIRAVIADQIYLSPSIAGVVLEDYVNHLAGSDAAARSTLTHREREVLQLLAEGKSTKEIALVLDVSGKTVETHRRHIMSKLNVYSVAELTKYAVREGLTSLEP